MRWQDPVTSRTTRHCDGWEVFPDEHCVVRSPVAVSGTLIDGGRPDAEKLPDRLGGITVMDRRRDQNWRSSHRLPKAKSIKMATPGASNMRRCSQHSRNISSFHPSPVPIVRSLPFGRGPRNRCLYEPPPSPKRTDAHFFRVYVIHLSVRLRPLKIYIVCRDVGSGRLVRHHPPYPWRSS